MNVKIKIYDKCKYNRESKKVAEVEYKNIESYEIVSGENAKRIGETTDANSRDDFNEYLIITFEDGTASTFRNSYVVMFIF